MAYSDKKRSRPQNNAGGRDSELINLFSRIDGRPYGAYKSAIGTWDYGDFTLEIDRIQSDPYAPPSSLRAITTPERMGLPEESLSTSQQRVATADYLLRAFTRAIHRNTAHNEIQIARVGAEILRRSACTVTRDRVEIRFQVQMPARGRTILGRAAASLFDRDIPDTIIDTCDFRSRDSSDHLHALVQHIHTYEDYCTLQQTLEDNQWIAFIANESILARSSGISQLPMENSVPFRSPESLSEEITLPHAGAIKGMAIRPGITIIAGGGYHGKSTLLNALQHCVYAHIPGDGRERVATVPEAVKVRAADGRSVTNVDISPFIAHLPDGSDTTHFSTMNASGSTSQAAAIVEAVELGAPVILMDEDTSATNLLIRDARMRALVASDKEPITPLVDRIRALYTERGVSTIMVMGGSGDYLDVADRVLMLDTYRCLDATEHAHEIVNSHPRDRSDLDDFVEPTPRCIRRFTSRNSRPKTKSVACDSITLDRQNINLMDVEQILDRGQTEAIAWAMRAILENFADGKTPLIQLLQRLQRQLNSETLDGLSRYGAHNYPPFLAQPRLVDIGAAINRFRGLTIEEQE